MARRKSGEQPVRVPTGGDFGARKQLESMQQSFPLPATGGGSAPPAPAAAGGGGSAPMPMPMPVDVFGPTQRPDEPLTAGAGPEGVGMLPPDPAELLRAIYLRYPSPGTRRLLEYAVTKGRRR